MTATTTISNISHNWVRKSKRQSRCTVCDEVVWTHSLSVQPDDCRRRVMPFTRKPAPAPVAVEQTATTEYTASPIKMHNGSWGVKVHHDGEALTAGTTVTVKTRAGKTWTADIVCGRGFANDGGRVYETITERDRQRNNYYNRRPSTTRRARCEDCGNLPGYGFGTKLTDPQGCECTGSYR